MSFGEKGSFFFAIYFCWFLWLGWRALARLICQTLYSQMFIDVLPIDVQNEKVVGETLLWDFVNNGGAWLCFAINKDRLSIKLPREFLNSHLFPKLEEESK